VNSVLIRNWWAVALRGALAILFGMLAILMPGVTLAAMVLIFGAYSVVDGVFALVAGLRAARHHERWWHLALEGIVDLVVGVIAWAIPLATALALLYLVSAWAIVTGLFRIAAAIRLRKEIEGEWLLVLNGALSVLFGIVIIAYPGAGLVTLVWLLGMYAMLFGIILVTLGFRLRSHGAMGASATSAVR
jgi:uncharacterized membrane protein HdeD (DUF308 family)